MDTKPVINSWHILLTSMFAGCSGPSRLDGYLTPWNMRFAFNSDPLLVACIMRNAPRTTVYVDFTSSLLFDTIDRNCINFYRPKLSTLEKREKVFSFSIIVQLLILYRIKFFSKLFRNCVNLFIRWKYLKERKTFW